MVGVITNHFVNLPIEPFLGIEVCGEVYDRDNYSHDVSEYLENDHEQDQSEKPRHACAREPHNSFDKRNRDK